MKLILCSIAIMLSAFTCPAEDIKWTYQQEDHEDASSSFVYFFKSNGHSIERVRAIWNGGAQNAPLVTDYLLNSGNLTIRHYVGKREALAAIMDGKDESLEIKDGYVLIGHFLRPSQPATTLTDDQKADLSNLIDLLAREKELVIAPGDLEAPHHKASEGRKSGASEAPVGKASGEKVRAKAEER